MKKALCILLLSCLCFPALTACGKIDYSEYLSDVRSDVFCAETEEFTLTLSCVSREHPFLADGIASERSDLVEIVLNDGGTGGVDYEIYVLGDTVWGGDMAFRNVSGDYYYSRGTDAFPEGNVSLRIQWGDETRELTVTSIKNENTLTVNEALQSALDYEKDAVSTLTRNGAFCGEIFVRLLRRDKTYYYVGIADTTGKTISLLLNSETGEILARRISG